MITPAITLIRLACAAAACRAVHAHVAGGCSERLAVNSVKPDLPFFLWRGTSRSAFITFI